LKRKERRTSFRQSDAIAQRSSPGLASNRANRHIVDSLRVQTDRPSPSAREFRLLLNGLAASALRRMFCSDEGACVRGMEPKARETGGLV
jgi:hypothetical protein